MNKRIFHITLPKCGSQWVRDVFASQDIWTDFKLQSAGANLDFLVDKDAFQLEGNFFAPIYNLTRQDWNAHHVTGDRAIVVLRDPRDRLVSLLFSLLYSHEGDVVTETWRKLLYSQNSINENLMLLVFIESAVPFYQSWSSDIPDDCMVIRYEDMVRDQAQVFRKIADGFGLRYSEAALDEAVGSLSFETRSGRARGTEDKFSHYRSGMPGDWKNHFDRSIGKLWEDMHPGILCKLGYEQSPDWWQALPEKHALDNAAHQPEIDRHPAQADRQAALLARIAVLEAESLGKHKEIELLARESSARLDLISRLESICQERLALINQLEQVAQDRLSLVNQLTDTCDERLRIIQACTQAADERLALIDQLHQTAEERQTIIAGMLLRQRPET